MNARTFRPYAQHFTATHAAWFMGWSVAGWYKTATAARKAGHPLPDPVQIPGQGLMYRRADLLAWSAKLETVKDARLLRRVGEAARDGARLRVFEAAQGEEMEA